MGLILALGQRPKWSPPPEGQTVTTTDNATSTHDAELLDELAAGRLCGMSGRSLRRLVDIGHAPRPRKLGRLIRYSRTELLAWIAGGCGPITEGRP